MRFQGSFTILLSFCLCVLFHPVPAGAAGPADWEVGKIVPDTYGYDQNGQLVNLRDFAGKNVIFEVSAAWCYPSFVLAAQVDAAKQYLEEKGVQLEYITVISQDPVHGTIPLRSQGLAWQKEFGSQTPILSYFNGPNIEGKIPIILSAPWLLKAAGNAFPAYAIIGPDQEIKKLQTGSLTPDQLVAEFLPDQPPLSTVEVPPAALAIKRAKLTAKLGAKSSVLNKAFVPRNGPGIPVYNFGKGTLPQEFAGGIVTTRAPQQEVWTVMFQGFINPFDGSPTLPADKPITLTVSNFHWDRTAASGMLASPKGIVRLSNNLEPVNHLPIEVPVRLKGGQVVIGPFEIGYTGMRMVDVDITWVAKDPTLSTAFLADYITMQFDLGEETQNDWNAQLREIEDGTKQPKELRKQTFAKIDKLTHQIFRYKGEGLPGEGRRFLVRGLSRVRAMIRDAK